MNTIPSPSSACCGEVAKEKGKKKEENKRKEVVQAFDRLFLSGATLASSSIKAGVFRSPHVSRVH
jgi:hypothetical protein